MVKILEKFKSNRFMRNFLKLFSATLFAQIFTIALSPLLTRLYTPEDFGVYSLYTALVSLLIVFVTGRYELAVPTAKSENESLTLLKLVIILTIVNSFVVFVVLNIFKIFTSGESKLYENDIVYYIPITLLGMGLLQGMNYYFNRKKDFSIIANAKVLQSIGNGFSTLGFATLGLHTLGMIWANILGVFVSNMYSLTKSKFWRIFNLKSYSIREILKVSKKYKHYPIWNSTSAFFDVLALQAPILIFTKYFSEIIVGFYSLTVRVVALPVTLISNVVGQIYLSDLSEKVRQDIPILPSILKARNLLLVIGIIPALVLFFFGPKLFSLVFGADWTLSGEISRILALAYYVKFVVSPLSVVYFVKNKVKKLSVLQISRAISTLLVLIISSKLFEEFQTVIQIYALHEIFFYGVYYFYIMRISK